MTIALGQLTPVYLEWAAKALTLAATGASWTVSSGRRAAHGVGQRGPFDSIPVDLAMSITCDFFVNYHADLAAGLGLINSVDGAELTTCYLTIGTVKIQGKMSALSFKISNEEELSGSLTIQGIAKTAVEAPSLPTAAALFSPNTLALTNLHTSAALQCSSLNISIANSVTGRRYMTASRLPAVLAEGKQTVAFDLTLLDVADLPADITAAALAKIAAPTIAVTDTQTEAKTLTFTFTNALAIEQTGTLGMEDILEHGIKYEAEAIAFGT